METVLKTMDKKETISEFDIDTYYNLNEQIKDLTKTMESYKSKIKNAMVSNELDTLAIGKYNVQISNRSTKKLDENMLVKVLTSRGIQNETTETKVVPVKEKVLEAISSGKLLQQEYDLCNSVSYSQVMSVKLKK